MNGKARATRWREKQVAEGGKPIGVTLTAQAAQALESLQAVFRWSQREAISLALEFAAGHPEVFKGTSDLPIPMDSQEDDSTSRRMEDLEQRLEQLEAMMAEKAEAARQESPEEGARKAKEMLITFTAKQMIEHGERMSRVQLYSLAKKHNMPVPPTQHEYNVFISYHMDMIREIMRSLRERTH
jgi:precorrin-2 methylase